MHTDKILVHGRKLKYELSKMSTVLSHYMVKSKLYATLLTSSTPVNLITTIYVWICPAQSVVPGVLLHQRLDRHQASQEPWLPLWRQQNSWHNYRSVDINLLSNYCTCWLDLGSSEIRGSPPIAHHLPLTAHNWVSRKVFGLIFRFPCYFFSTALDCPDRWREGKKRENEYMNVNKWTQSKVFAKVLARAQSTGISTDKSFVLYP